MKKFLVILILIFLFAGLGIWHSWPLAEHFTAGMPYTHAPFPEYKIAHLMQGDYIQLYYYFWLLKDSILGHIPFFSNTYEFNTGEFINKFSFQGLPISVLFFVFSVFGNIAGYNLFVITTFVLSGISAYLLVKCYTDDFFSGLAGGIIFAVAPYRLCQVFGGHPGGFSVWLLPLSIHFLEMSFKKKSVLYSVLSGICIMSLGLLESHLVYYIYIFIPVYIIFRLYVVDAIISSKPKIQNIKNINKIYFYVMAAMGLCVSAFVWMYYFRRTHSNLLYLQMYTMFFSSFMFWLCYSYLVSFITKVEFEKILKKDLFTYIPIFCLLLYAIQFKYDIPSFGRNLILFAFMGVVVLKIIFVLPYIFKIFSFIKKTFIALSGYLRTLIPIFIFMGVYAGWVMWDKFTRLDVSRVGSGRTFQEIRLYSPRLQDIFTRFNSVGEHFIYLGLIPVILGLAGIISLRKRYNKYIVFYAVCFFVSYILVLGPSFDEIFPLYRVFYYVVPGFDYSRVPARIIYISFMALIVLAGFGMKGRKKIFSLAVTALLIWDFSPKHQIGISILPNENKVYKYLSESGYKNNVIDIPIWPGDSSWSSLYEYYITLYRIKTINGYDPTVSQNYVDNVAEALFSVNLGQISYKQCEILKSLSVKYLLFHEEAYPEKVCPFPSSFAKKLLKESPYLEFVMSDGIISLFKIKDKIENIDSKIDYFKSSSIVYNIYEAEWLPRVTGRVVEMPNASNCGVVCGKKDVDKAGFLTFGPHRTYPIGRYTAVFRLMADFSDNSIPLAKIEVTTDKGNTILNSRIITGVDFAGKNKFHDLLIPFTVKKNSSLEFRVNYFSKADVWIDCIIVAFSSETESKFSFEAEDLIKETGNILEDLGASGGYAVYASPENSDSLRLMQGPYRTFERGKYTAMFRLKADIENVNYKQDIPVVLLQAAADFGKKEYRRKLVMLSDFETIGKYVEFELPFSLDERRELDFRVTYKGKAGVWVDRVDIKYERK